MSHLATLKRAQALNQRLALVVDLKEKALDKVRKDLAALDPLPDRRKIEVLAKAAGKLAKDYYQAAGHDLLSTYFIEWSTALRNVEKHLGVAKSALDDIKAGLKK